MENIKKYKKILEKLSCSIPLLIVVVGCKLHLIYYIVNDDFEMNFISMGIRSGKPDEHLVYIKSIIGCLLKFLYNHFQGINWFGIFYLFVILLCIYIIFIFINKRTKYLYAMLITVLIELIILCWLTFTTIAYLCVLASAIALSGIEKQLKKPSKIWVGVVISLLLLIAYILRWESVITGLLLLTPLIIYNIKKASKIIVVVILAVTVIGCLGIDLVEAKAYNKYPWTGYLEYNSARGGIVDHPILDYESGYITYKESHLSRNDYKCLTRWIYADKKVFSSKVLRKLSDVMNITKRYETNIFRIVKKIIGIKEFWLFLLILSSLLFLTDKNRKYQLVQGLFTVGLVSCLVILNKPEPRIYVIIFLLGNTSLYYLYISNNTKKNIFYANKYKKTFLYLAIFSVITCVFCYIKMNKGQKMIYQDREAKYKEIREYINNNRNKLFVTTFSDDYLDYQSVVEISSASSYINIADDGRTWSIYNDFYYEQAQKYKFHDKDRLLLELAANDNVYYLCHNNENIFLLKTYIEEHSGKKVDVNKFKEFQTSGDCIYKFTYTE